MNYRQRRAEECQKLFANFQPDLSGCRDKEELLQVLSLAREGAYSAEIAQIIGKTPKAVQKMFRRYNFPVLHNFAPQIESERPNWKGGVKIVNGYAYKRCPWHPNKSKHGGYVSVHRLIVEEHLGRFLLRTEVVHHKDDNPLNNTIENLEVFASNGEHLKATLTGKCPNWTEEGKASIAKALRQRWEDYASQKELATGGS